MEKNRLDDFFKKKLDHRSFEPPEDFWKEAEAMIEAQESDQRNWRYFWWSLGLFMLIGTALTWFNWDRWDPANQQQSSNNTIELSQNKNTANTIESETTKQIENNDKGDISNQLDTPKNNLTDSKITETKEVITHSNSSQTASQNTLATNTDAISPRNTTVSKSTQARTEKYLSAPQEDVSFSAEGQKMDTNRASSRQAQNDITNSTFLEKDQRTNTNNTPSDQTSTDITNVEASEINTISPNQNTTARGNSASLRLTDKQQNQTTTILLSSIPFVVDIPERELELGNPVPYKSTYPLPRRRRFNLGFQAGISLFPGNSDEKFFTGYEAGMTAKYQIGKHWSVGADLLFIQNTGTFDTIGTVVQNVYGFGKETTTYTLERSSLNFIEVPVYAQFKVGKHLLEAGIGFNYLLGVRGALVTKRSLFPWERSNLDNFEETTIEDKTWITKQGFPNWHTNAFMGYRFQLSKQLNLGVRARFVFYKEQTPISQATEEIKINYKEFRPMTFRVNLRYYFVK